MALTNGYYITSGKDTKKCSIMLDIYGGEYITLRSWNFFIGKQNKVSTFSKYGQVQGFNKGIVIPPLNLIDKPYIPTWKTRVFQVLDSNPAGLMDSRSMPNSSITSILLYHEKKQQWSNVCNRKHY